MDTLPVNEFRRQVGEYLNQTYYAGKAFTLLKGNRRMAALIPIAMLDRLVELENELQTRSTPGTAALTGSMVAESPDQTLDEPISLK